MALKPWELERIESRYTFDKMLAGAIRRYQLLEDLIGYNRLDILTAGGAKYAMPGAPTPSPDPTRPTFESVVGRSPVPLIGQSRQPTPEEQEAEQERIAELEAKAARIQAMHFEAVMRRDHPEMIVGETPPRPEAESSPPE